MTPAVVECFVCYLAAHNRPVHELLFSRDRDMTGPFENEFAGMTRKAITLSKLVTVRRLLKKDLPNALTSHQRRFLLGFVAGQPDWTLMTCEHLAKLPAIRWKLDNLAKLKKSNPKKFEFQASELQARFDAL